MPVQRSLSALSCIALIGLCAGSVAAQPVPLNEEPLGAPFRIRDYTFPSFLVLGFTPAPAAPLGRGHTALELHYSVVNNFQVSEPVEEYLSQTRGNHPRPLDSADAAFILGLPEGEAYYIDGEFVMVELAAHWGITERIDLGFEINYIHYGGRLLDGVIFEFHDAIGVSQGGRQYVQDHQVQAVLGRDSGQDVVLLQRPASGGLSDPNLFLRYALPTLFPHWGGNIELGIKVPVMDEADFLSTGSWDVGYQITLDRRFSRDALIINFGAVFPGKFEQTDFRPPNLPFLNISWLHRFERWPHTRSFVQALWAEHPYRAILDSELSDLEFQITAGFKWDARLGVFGVGLTENVLNFDNTPDIGLHFTWGMLD